MKKLKRVIKQSIISVCAMALLLTMLPQAVQAQDDLDLSKDVSVTIAASCDGVPMASMNFRIYKVATIENTDLTFKLTNDFKNSGAILSTSNDQNDWNTATSALARAVVSNSVSATAIATTDANGSAAVSKDSSENNLSAGIYLMMGSKITIGEYTYTPQDTLIVLPYKQDLSDNSEKWDYSPTVSPKIDRETATEQTKDLHAVVVWDDNNDAAGVRPESVTLVLHYQDGNGYTQYQSVTVSADNNWRYTFKNVPANAQWYLVEEGLPAAYSYTVSREGDTFIVTNTIKTADTTTTPTTGGKTSTGGTSGGSKLPQTGQLWWPVAFLAAGGAALIAMGLALRKKRAAV